MAYIYVVLGAGRQGCAAAFDLVRFGEAQEVRLLDQDGARAERVAERLNRLLASHRVCGGALDSRQGEALQRALLGAAGVFSALPYALNPPVARGALKAKACYCDLGGNTGLVREVLELDGAARAREVSLVPDCGLAPGLGNQLAALGLCRLPGARHVRIYCGGLPEHPCPPLGYKLVFSIAGLTNEYRGQAEVLREGQRLFLEACTECEELDWEVSGCPLEAFLTSGGTSTCPESYAGRLLTYVYKTLRYRGHFERVRAMIDLGLLDEEPVLVAGHEVVPRQLFHACAAPRLEFPDQGDLVLLRIRLEDPEGHQALIFDLEERGDVKDPFSAMERCTAFPAAATLYLQVRGEMPPGARPPHLELPAERFLEEVQKRGLLVRERWESLGSGRG